MTPSLQTTFSALVSHNGKLIFTTLLRKNMALSREIQSILTLVSSYKKHSISFQTVEDGDKKGDNDLHYLDSRETSYTMNYYLKLKTEIQNDWTMKSISVNKKSTFISYSSACVDRTPYSSFKFWINSNTVTFTAYSYISHSCFLIRTASATGLAHLGVAEIYSNLSVRASNSSKFVHK